MIAFFDGGLGDRVFVGGWGDRVFGGGLGDRILGWVDWAIAFLLWGGDRVFVGGWAIVFLRGIIGRSPLREKLVNILTMQKSYKD